MNQKTTVTVVGGDSRQLHMALRLHELGYLVNLSAFELTQQAEPLCNYPVTETIPASKTIIFPLPVSRDGKLLNASFSKSSIALHSVIQLIHPDSTVFCGMPPDFFAKTLEAHGIRVIDYFKNDELTLQNALLTAEGIVGLLTDELPFTIFGLQCAITGYGRVAKYTARALHALGADVTVFARNSNALAQAKNDFLKAEPLVNLDKLASNFSCIINTVPASVINEKTVQNSNTDCVFIEVASAPFGIDFKAVADNRRRLIKAVSLPGKTAPKTAGEIIAGTIHNYISEGFN